MNCIKRRLILITAILLIVSCTSGCLRISPDDLYSLPEASEDYLKLRAHINSVRSLGSEFSPPTGGPNRQSVQLKDLNGDGVNEVIAFFTVVGDSSLEIYLFEMFEGDYTVAGVIRGVGTAFESVRYADMDGDGIMEMIVGWQMGASLKHLSIYSIKDFSSAILISSEEYSEISIYDVTGDGNRDVIVLRLPSPETGAIAKVYSLMPDGEVVSAEARLSAGIETIMRVQTGRLVDGVPAVFVESAGMFDEGGFVTDICAYKDDVFVNISIKSPGYISEETVRTGSLYCSDINKNGIIKVPKPRLLQAQSETPYYAIDWFAFSSSGKSELALTTYHNTYDEWFLILPDNWRGNVSIRREDTVSGERNVIFSHIARDGVTYDDFLKVYKISGDTREERAKLPGRVPLLSEGAAVYAFELLAEPNSYGLTFDEKIIRDNFRLIYSEWLSGTA